MTALDRWSETSSSALERAQAGCDDAFAEIVKANESMVYSICLHALRDRAQAEEVAQEVFLQLYRTLDRLKSESHVVNWLRRATSHRVIDVCRTSRRASRERESGARVSGVSRSGPLKSSRRSEPPTSSHGAAGDRSLDETHSTFVQPPSGVAFHRVPFSSSHSPRGAPAGASEPNRST